ncbi:SDR family NAD(P)-dependent oxidoreductase [Nocardia sp. NPDC056611]|uniref:SDR family NAD(P)-dependent oxidoreductase n=1 Tax=Nocardia sp. NPDC056611 TaxID=3345877 RepID=UPI00366B901D
MNTNLTGRTVIVTGGAQGIGLETARQIVKSGGRVAILDVDGEAAAAAAGGLGSPAVVQAFAADVRNPDSIEAALIGVHEQFGGYDTVVVNAGVGLPLQTFRSTAAEQFARVVDVNLVGAANTVRATLPTVIEHAGQYLIVSSVVAFNNGALESAYAASKAAVEALGRALQMELVPYGVDVTIAYPGYVRTGMLDLFWENEVARRFDRTIPKFLKGGLSAQTAGQAMAGALVKPTKALVFPGRWRPIKALRGLWGPLSEATLSRNTDFAAAVALSDSEVL